MGRTPFGDLRRSWALVITAMLIAVLGMAACFIPKCFAEIVRVLAGGVLAPGGVVLLVQLFGSQHRARAWMRIPGVLRHLTFACGLVYVLMIVTGLITLFPGLSTTPQTAVLLVLNSMGLFYLSLCSSRAARVFPPEKPTVPPEGTPSSGRDHKGRPGIMRDASLSLPLATMILLGTLLVVLGLLLFPVTLGMIPFSPDGQLGLMLTIVAIQMMVLGDTPLGHYKRSWLMVLAGVAFAALGIFSCIVPGLLTAKIQFLLGVLNCAGGTFLLITLLLPMLKRTRDDVATAPGASPITKKLTAVQIAIDVAAIVFGLSMLIPDLVSGLAVAGILIINGMLLFVLASIIRRVTGIQAG